MNIRFLGVGGAFDPEYGSSAAVIDTGDRTLTLLDCGCTTYGDLRRNGVVDEITHVLITHLHDDHCGSLGSLINHHFHSANKKLTLVCPPALEAPLRTLLQLQRTNRPLDEVLYLHHLEGEKDHPSRTLGASRIDFIETTGLHQANMLSFAYVARGAEGVLAFSGDLGDADYLVAQLEQRGYAGARIFHDVTFSEKAKGSHVYYEALQPHLSRWVIYGYHNRPDQKPSDCLIPLAYENADMHPLLY